MNRTTYIVTLLAIAAVATAPIAANARPHASTAGAVIAGLAVGLGIGMIAAQPAPAQTVVYAQPAPAQTVVYAQTVPAQTVVYTQPSPVQTVVYTQPPVVYTPPVQTIVYKRDVVHVPSHRYVHHHSYKPPRYAPPPPARRPAPPPPRQGNGLRRR